MIFFNEFIFVKYLKHTYTKRTKPIVRVSHQNQKSFQNGDNYRKSNDSFKQLRQLFYSFLTAETFRRIYMLWCDITWKSIYDIQKLNQYSKHPNIINRFEP